LAHPARAWALLHNCQWIIDALASIRPDLALGLILVSAPDNEQTEVKGSDRASIQPVSWNTQVRDEHNMTFGTART